MLFVLPVSRSAAPAGWEVLLLLVVVVQLVVLLEQLLLLLLRCVGHPDSLTLLLPWQRVVLVHLLLLLVVVTLLPQLIESLPLQEMLLTFLCTPALPPLLINKKSVAYRSTSANGAKLLAVHPHVQLLCSVSVHVESSKGMGGWRYAFSCFSGCSCTGEKRYTNTSPQKALLCSVASALCP